ncbi:PREDICTED: uncharacterized protein LOC109362312 isoform X2 [Lupinus angustifolius]|uniref:uncharacterized protein LOC109362312 isoform X2 n=1 Tax=Lupinus angustifolius TaxID=3871 RepID=UPI00092EA068|nr:PREDICTED: uncharacterized protein LOC109362312 isoform X2 [Lupinus angustifolius]
MDKFCRTNLLFLLFCIVFILQFHPATLDEGSQNFEQNHPEKPRFPKILMDTISLLKKSQESSWDKLKTVIHDLQMQFSPPNLEGGREGGSDGTKGKMKEAVEKSFERSKETVEGSAKLAAKVVGEAFHKTTETMKESADSDRESKEEL